MMLTVEYLTGLLSQIDSLTKELKDRHGIRQYKGD